MPVIKWWTFFFSKIFAAVMRKLRAPKHDRSSADCQYIFANMDEIRHATKRNSSANLSYRCKNITFVSSNVKDLILRFNTHQRSPKICIFAKWYQTRPRLLFVHTKKETHKICHAIKLCFKLNQFSQNKNDFVAEPNRNTYHVSVCVLCLRTLWSTALNRFTLVSPTTSPAMNVRGFANGKGP